MKSLTSFDQKALKAVDYASGILLYDNLLLLKEITNTIEGLPKATAMMMITKLEHFMKYDFLAHRSIADATSHNIGYALGGEVCSTFVQPVNFHFR